MNKKKQLPIKYYAIVKHGSTYVRRVGFDSRLEAREYMDSIFMPFYRALERRVIRQKWTLERYHSYRRKWNFFIRANHPRLMPPSPYEALRKAIDSMSELEKTEVLDQLTKEIHHAKQES